ncbi:MAG: hypothetical protein ACP5H3_02180 [Candidatus Aenigmatarchaeota archaeon]
MAKSIIFTTDILVGIGLTATLLALIFIGKPEVKSEISFQSNWLEAKDIVNILSNLKASSFSNTPTIKSLIENGTLKEEDLNKTIIDLIGSFWYAGNKTIASNITKEILENVTKKCFSLQTENETVYSSCLNYSKSISVAYALTSGYEIGKPVSGYVARAWLTKYRKNTTQIIPFYPEGSGWTGNRLEVTKYFSLPPNITIYNATLFVSIHFGTSKSQAQFEQLVVNGVQKKNDVIWLYLQEASGWYGEITTAAYGYVDVTNEIKAGNNTIYLVIGTPNYHSHIHPGMRLIVTYSLSQEMQTGNQTFVKRYYFDNVVGNTGAWSMVSFYVPENAKNVNAKLHLNLKNIDDTKYFIWNTTDIEIYVNSKYPFYKDGINTGEDAQYYCYSIRKYYCYRDIAASKSVILDFDITSNLKNGTNVVSVYLNSYGDLHWGYKDANIYSNPLGDAENSSYVEVSYELESPSFNYGEIDLTKEILFGGTASNPKTFTFNISERESKIVESFVHIAQGFSSTINVSVFREDLPKFTVFTSPSPRIVPENVYVYPNLINVGKNNIEIVDFQPYGGISPTNYILPWSSFEYTYLVKGMVGYGNVFNSSQLAIQDAIDRLIQQIGNDISAQDISVDSQSVQGIRWLWGPTFFKILVWDKL